MSRGKTAQVRHPRASLPSMGIDGGHSIEVEVAASARLQNCHVGSPTLLGYLISSGVVELSRRIFCLSGVVPVRVDSEVGWDGARIVCDQEDDACGVLPPYPDKDVSLVAIASGGSQRLGPLCRHRLTE
jgi:hypothetical protein